jgi:hypothetical protein
MIKQVMSMQNLNFSLIQQRRVEALRYERKVAGLIPDGVIGIFLWLNFSGRNDPRVDSASNGNEYNKGCLLGVKADGA